MGLLRGDFSWRFHYNQIYIQTPMLRTSFGPWKFDNGDNFGMSFRSSI